MLLRQRLVPGSSSRVTTIFWFLILGAASVSSVRRNFLRWDSPLARRHAGRPCWVTGQFQPTVGASPVRGRSHGAASDSGSLIFHGICAPAIRLPAGALAPRPMTPAVPFPACPVRSRGRGGWLQQAPPDSQGARPDPTPFARRARAARGGTSLDRPASGGSMETEWQRKPNPESICCQNHNLDLQPLRSSRPRAGPCLTAWYHLWIKAQKQ